MIYPLDTMKTIIQVRNLSERTITQLEAFRMISQQGGINGFFKGLAPCALRAFIVNAVVFYSNEIMHGILFPKDLKL